MAGSTRRQPPSGEAPWRFHQPQGAGLDGTSLLHNACHKSNIHLLHRITINQAGFSSSSYYHSFVFGVVCVGSLFGKANNQIPDILFPQPLRHDMSFILSKLNLDSTLKGLRGGIPLCFVFGYFPHFALGYVGPEESR